jgi:PASTA domain-containing protein
VRTKNLGRTPISAAVLTVLCVAGCASEPTDSAVGSSPPIASAVADSGTAAPGPVASAPAVSVPAVSAPASSSPPDPCDAPIVEKTTSVPDVPMSDPAPVSLRICHPGIVRGRGQSVVLSGNDANNIGKLLDLAPAGTANCAYKPDVVLRFAYDDGTEEDVEVATVGCDQPAVFVGGRTWLITQTLADYLASGAIAPGLPSNPVPDVTALSLAEATAIITKAGLTIRSGGYVTDPLLSADTVVLQDPPGGTGIIGSEVYVLLSQQPARDCSAAQLAVDYHGLSYGTGEAFSDLDVRDTADTPCTLTGPISVVGLDAAGHAVTNQLTFTVVPDLILTARTPARVAGADVANGAVIAWVPLSADIRDGPDVGGSCAYHLVTPRTWIVTVGGGEKPVPNGAGVAEPPMGACLGRLDVPINPQQITALS